MDDGEARNHEAEDHADDIEMAFTQGYRQGRQDALDSLRRSPQGHAEKYVYDPTCPECRAGRSPQDEDHEAGQDFTHWFTDYPSTHRLAGQTVEVTPVRPSPERNTEAEVERLREALETIQALSADDAEIARKALEGPSDV